MISIDMSSVPEENSAYLRDLHAEDGNNPNVRFESQTQVIYDQNYPLSADQLNVLKLLPDIGDVKSCDFENPRSVANTIEMVKQTVSKATDGLINDIQLAPSELDEVSLLLVNTTSFTAPWNDQFYTGNTKPELFYVNGTDPISVDMMKKLKTTFAINVDFGPFHQTIVKINYKGEFEKNYNMLLALPTTEMTSAQVSPRETFFWKQSQRKDLLALISKIRQLI
ncbi:serpin family protein [Glaciimonas sp. GG7]